MITPAIALPANLNNEDDDGLNRSLLRKAVDRGTIVEGAVVVGGTEHFWSWVRIRRIDADGQVDVERITAEEAPRSVSSAS